MYFNLKLQKNNNGSYFSSLNLEFIQDFPKILTFFRRKRNFILTLSYYFIFLGKTDFILVFEFIKIYFLKFKIFNLIYFQFVFLDTMNLF